MAFEPKDNSGALFRSKEQKTDRHPTHDGSCMIDGREYWISAWVKESKAGNKFFSLAFKPKEQRADEGYREAAQPLRDPARQGPPDDPLDGDDVPF